MEQQHLRLDEPDERPASLDEARRQAAGCTRCHLYRHATQTVFGEGPAHAPVVLVGEQPGDSEDLAGRPFVGPAGRLLDAVLAEAGVERDKCYVTNAVKHFKFAERGKRRLHKRPDAGEIEACRWWLDIERVLLRPKLIVALGATAAQALTGNGKGIMKRRGHFETIDGGTRVLMTVHPSSILRVQQHDDKGLARAALRRDLAMIAEAVPEVRAKAA